MSKKIYVAGHCGMVGSALVRQLQQQADAEIITRTHTELDLTDQAAVRDFFQQERIDEVYLAAARVGVIHANKGQGNRTKTMDAFRAGETPVLVATDLAARGIDVDDISHVFNFDMPTEPETYVHRIGRTARAGASGSAVSFCDTEEKRLLKQVERLLGTTIPVVKQHPYAGVKPVPTEEDMRDAMFEARSKERMRARGQGRGRQGSPLGAPRGGQAPRQQPTASGGQRGDGRQSPRGGQARQDGQRGRGQPDRRDGSGNRQGQGSPASARPAPRRDAPRYEPPARSSRDVRSVIDEITGRRS